ncbi:MAG: hypothetical protein RRZ84_05960 [Romboutsia sp.]
MKLIKKLNKTKNKNFLISTLVVILSTSILTAMKIIENKKLEDYNSFYLSDTNTSLPYEIVNEEILGDYSTDQDYYNEFIGLPTEKLTKDLEASFWEVIEYKDNFVTYQNTNGNKVKIYFDEKNIIEKIDSLGLN